MTSDFSLGHRGWNIFVMQVKQLALGVRKKLNFFLVIPSSLSCGKVDCWSPSRCFHSLTEVPGKGKKEAAVWSADWQTAKAPTVVVEKN